MANLQARHPYFRLMRLHQPVGIWLLLWPCWWSYTLASKEKLEILPLFLFALGAVLMRAAGCIINDITDRKFDRAVERTRNRPLVSGEISLKQALGLLAFLLLLALITALALGWPTFLISLAAMPLVIAYPWMKRITWWPQAFLGLTFNWGALAGWVAAKGILEWPAILLYAACVFWTLGYDTIYAHQDKQDDALIGVKSSARRLGGKTYFFVGLCYFAFIIGLSICGMILRLPSLFYVFAAFTALDLAWQVWRLDIDNPEKCRLLFMHNALTGLIVFLACIGARQA